MKLQLDEHVWSLLKRHSQHTLTYWSVFFSFGLCISFLGPTILDLRCQTQSTLEQITWVFFSQQFFLLVGSCLGGLLKKTLLSSLLALFSCTLIISLVFATIPLCHHIVPLFITIAIAGSAMGVIDTIANLQLVNLYQKDSAVFLQVLHFFIGLGALVSPLVADPFLSEENCDLGNNWTANSSSLSSSSSSSSSSLNLHHNQNSIAKQGAAPANISQVPLHAGGLIITRVSYAFWIISLINLPVPLAVLTLMYRERMFPCSGKGPRQLDEKPPSCMSPTVDIGHGGNWFACCSLSNMRGHSTTFFILHALGGAIVFISDGIIGSYAGFVYTYAVSPPLLLGHKAAGCLDSVFWASITTGRLAFIYVSYKYTAPRLLTLSLLGVILVHFLLVIFYTSSEFLFIGTCILGLCISSVFPSMLAYTEDILNYTGCATTVLVTSASTGEMMLQLIIGYVMQSQGSYTFLLCCTVASFIVFCFFLLFMYFQQIHGNCNRGPY